MVEILIYLVFIVFYLILIFHFEEKVKNALSIVLFIMFLTKALNNVKINMFRVFPT